MLVKLLFLLFLSSLLLFYVYTSKPIKIIELQDIEPLISSKSKNQELTYPALTIDKIFSKDHSWIKSLPSEVIITLTAAGDIIPARAVNNQTVKLNNFLWPYEKTANLLKNADITFVNLETPLIKGCPVTVEGMVFCGDAMNATGLKFAGIDIVSMGNNHAGNYGVKGVEETKDLLTNFGIQVTGIESSGPVYEFVKGFKFAFLGYNDISKLQPGVKDVDEEKLKEDIALAKKQADLVIVTFHWGEEYRRQPDERQIYLGHLAIDAGADLVIGNHPHWIQPIEFYKGKLITYAHGNFVFDQMWSQKTREGVVGKYTFYKKQLVDVEYTPIQINDYGQPNFVDLSQANSILEDMRKQSEILVNE